MESNILLVGWIRIRPSWTTSSPTSIVDLWDCSWLRSKQRRSRTRLRSISKMLDTTNTTSGHLAINWEQACSYGWALVYLSTPLSTTWRRPQTKKIVEKVLICPLESPAHKGQQGTATAVDLPMVAYLWSRQTSSGTPTTAWPPKISSASRLAATTITMVRFLCRPRRGKKKAILLHNSTNKRDITSNRTGQEVRRFGH